MSALVFPSLAGLDIKITRAPLDATRIDEAVSGKEVRSTWSTWPRYRYQLDFNVLRADSALSDATRQLEWQKLLGFVQRHGTRQDSFLFTDPDDSSVTAHAFGVGNGVTTDFQLQRTLVADADLAAAGSRSYWPLFSDGYEPISELNGSPSIYKDGALQTITTHYTLPGYGVVHFVSAPGNTVVLTWTGSFYRRVRIDMDSVPTTRLFQSVYEAKSIQLMSVK